MRVAIILMAGVLFCLFVCGFFVCLVFLVLAVVDCGYIRHFCGTFPGLLVACFFLIFPVSMLPEPTKTFIFQPMTYWVQNSIPSLFSQKKKPLTSSVL